MGSQTTSAFPTLDEQLAHPPAKGDSVARRPPVAVFEGVVPTPEVVALLPEGTLVATIAGRAPATAEGDERPASVRQVPATLDELVRLVRLGEGDLLLVSDAALLDPGVLSGLETGLANDSACSSVSVDEGSRPVAAGLPPPAIDAPRAGVVLVRRDDLVLATDEAELTGRFVAGTVKPADAGSVVAQLLSLLERPGFVHRAYGLEGDSPPVRRHMRGHRASRPKASVCIDGTCLANPLTGTQVQVMELVAALARAGADVTVMRPSQLHHTVAPKVARLAGDVRFVERRALGCPEVFHRPYQIVSLHDLADRLVIGDRLALTHQDMIWNRSRAYHHDDDGWRDYRIATTAALSAADEVGFFSLSAAMDAASEGVVDLDRATVVPLGVDHLATREVAENAARPLERRPYILMLGSSFWHKNRVFSLRVVAWLVERHGWDGGLVFVGGHDPRTSSVPAEELFLRRTPALGGRVVDLGHVPEPEQGALYRDAELVLFPSLYEGFGFIPFEAAALGTACVYTRRSAMGELLPPAGRLPSFDIEQAGGFVLRLLESRVDRDRIVAEISSVAAGLTWDRTAAGYQEVYARALGRPRQVAGRLLRAGLEQTGGLTPREAALLHVYRTRRGARLAIDALVRAGMAVTAGSRRIGVRRRTDE